MMNGVIREAIQSANQMDAGDDKTTADEDDADEDYDFGRDHPVRLHIFVNVCSQI